MVVGTELQAILYGGADRIVNGGVTEWWCIQNCKGVCTSFKVEVCMSFKVGGCTGFFMVLGDRISGLDLGYVRVLGGYIGIE
jgi:hypothetical protein